MLFQHLPPELQKEIYRWCSKEDLLNIACSCSQCYLDVKPLLWKNVFVSWNFLRDSDLISKENKQKLAYMKSTEVIRLSFSKSSNNMPNTSFTEAHPNISANFKLLIGHCDPAILKQVSMHNYRCDIDGECAHLMCGQLKNLEKLSVYDDVLPAQLYVAISGLKNLTYLNLMHSKTTDIDMLCICRNLSKLKYLDIKSSRVTDKGLVGISNLMSLEILKMGYNYDRITETGISHLSGLINLQKLEAASLHKLSHFPSLKNLPSLKDLNLRSTNVKDNDFFGISKNLKFLQVLDIGFVGITDKCLSYLGEVLSLVKLDVSGTLVTAAGVQELARLPSLKDLNLGQTSFTDIGLFYMKDMKLESLGVYGTEITDTGLEYISGMASLHTLDCSQNAITDVGVEIISRLPNLKCIGVEVSEGGVTCDGLMQHLKSMKHLKKITCLRSYEKNEEFIQFCRSKQWILNSLLPSQY